MNREIRASLANETVCAFGGLNTTGLQYALEGVLLGTAVGDALGLPAENLSPRRIQRRWKGQWRMRFDLNRGMISDDTEHTFMVAQTLLSHCDDAAAFQRALAWRFRWWFADLPGGMGLATAKACLKLWVGVPPSRSAVVSAGSGPAMRSAILGAFFAGEPEKRREFVRASSRLTHRGWQAETAALAIAEVVALILTERRSPDGARILSVLRELSTEEEWQNPLSQIQSALDAGHSVSELVRRLGLERGVTGYSLHVVPVALYAWLRHPCDFRAALASALECGGDTDTVGAIVGALCGASGGVEGIPREWLNFIVDWPRSVPLFRRAAQRLTEQKQTSQPIEPVRYFWPGILPRNLVFLVIVLLHGFRRLLPPY